MTTRSIRIPDALDRKLVKVAETEHISLKSAALLHSVICNHAFVDGNKRTAWVATRVLLALHGKRPGLTEDQAYELVIRIATSCSQIEVKEIAAALAVTSVGG